MSKLRQLILCDSTPIQLDAAGKLPSRMLIMKWGANPGAKGTFIVNETTLAQMPKNQAATNFDRVVLDFEHNTVKGSSTYKGEPCENAANGIPEVVRGEGIYLNSMEWTKEGEKYVGGKHYVDLSPSILTSDKDEVIFLHSVGACRQGALVGNPITLSATDFPALNLTSNIMKREHLITLLTAAGIEFPANATDDQLVALIPAAETKIKTLSADPAKKEAIVVVDDVKDPALATALKTLTATLAEQGKTLTLLTGKLTTMEAAKSGDEIALILNQAALDGKVVPKEFVEGDTKVTAPILKLLVAAIPSTIPLDRRTSAVQQKQGDQLVMNSAEDEVRKQLGLSEDEWKKDGKAA